MKETHSRDHPPQEETPISKRKLLLQSIRRLSRLGRTSFSRNVYSIVVVTFLLVMTSLRAVTSSSSPSIRVRLYMVRHGESEANQQNCIAGQQDFNLTPLGRQQAVALGKSSWFITRESTGKEHGHENTAKHVSSSRSLFVRNFWKLYVSDLQRAIDTANLALQSAEQEIVNERDNDEATKSWNSLLIRDVRLREKAHGALEGYSRSMTYERAVEDRRQKRQLTIEQGVNEDDDSWLPLLETEDDLWVRVRNWLDDLLAEVVNDATSPATSDPLPANGQVPQASTLPAHTTQRYDILLVAHAGVLRQLLRRLIGDDTLRQHPRGKYDPNNDTRLLIPNTSVTILDLYLQCKAEKSGAQSNSGESIDVILDVPAAIQRAELKELNWVEHLLNVENTISNVD